MDLEGGHRYSFGITKGNSPLPDLMPGSMLLLTDGGLDLGGTITGSGSELGSQGGKCRVKAITTPPARKGMEKGRKRETECKPNHNNELLNHTPLPRQPLKQ